MNMQQNDKTYYILVYTLFDWFNLTINSIYCGLGIDSEISRVKSVRLITEGSGHAWYI